QAGAQSIAALQHKGFAYRTAYCSSGYYIMAGDGCSDLSQRRFYQSGGHRNPARCVELVVQVGQTDVNAFISGQINGVSVSKFPMSNGTQAERLSWPVQSFLKSTHDAD